MTAYRFGVTVPGLPTIWYGMGLEMATFCWQLLKEYGRGDVLALVERRDPDGEWTTILGLRTTGGDQ